MKKSEIRVIEWVAPGYEGSYTQYAFTYEDDYPMATLWITQIATKDNLGRKLQSVEPYSRRVPLNVVRDHVDSLIRSRTEDGSAKELT